MKSVFVGSEEYFDQILWEKVPSIVNPQTGRETYPLTKVLTDSLQRITSANMESIVGTQPLAETTLLS